MADDSYDPFEDRDVEHQTSDYGAFTHMLKGCLGAGLLAMPLAFSHSGWIVGTILTLLIGGATTFCMNMLVWALWEEMKKNKVPLMTYSEACESSFASGPQWIKRVSKAARVTVDFFLVFQLLGICAVYVLFVASTINEVLEKFDIFWNVRISILILWPVLILMSMIKTLKFLSPLSILANLFMLAGLILVYYIFFIDLKSMSEINAQQDDLVRIPLFFGIVVFSLEGIGVVVSIENSMKNPRHFLHCPCILNISMFIVTIAYLFTGFFGYLRYGDDVNDNVTKNLPFEGAGLAGKILISGGIFLSYCIQFYPPMEIIWSKVDQKVPAQRSICYNILIRIALVTLTIVAALSIPNLGIMMSLMGSLCLSVLGFVFPPLMELFTFYERKGYGFLGYRLIRNMLFIAFGLFAMVAGLYSNIVELVEQGFDDRRHTVKEKCLKLPSFDIYLNNTL